MAKKFKLERREGAAFGQKRKKGSDEAQLEPECAEVRRASTEKDVRFVRKGDLVSVHGVRKKPIVANYRDWLRFIHWNGPEKLHEFILNSFTAPDPTRMVQ